MASWAVLGLSPAPSVLVVSRRTAADPIGISGGINLYRYAATNPINRNDPRGTQPCNSSNQSCLPEPEANSSTSEESEQQASSVKAHKADVQRDEDVRGYQSSEAQAQLVKEGKAQLPPFDAKGWEKKIVATLRQTNTEKHKLARQIEQAADKQKADAEAHANAYREQQEAIEQDSPSTAVSLIPVVGEGKTAYANFKHGEYAGGVLHLGLAITDVTGVKAVAEGGAKLTLKLLPFAEATAKSSAIPRLTLKAAQDEGRYVFRQLSAADRLAIEAGEGIAPKGVGGSIAQQVAGGETNYISASLGEAATRRFASGNGLIAIDAEAAVRSGAGFVEHNNVLQALRRLGTPRDLRNAVRAEEVLFRGSVPIEAIRIINW